MAIFPKLTKAISTKFQAFTRRIFGVARIIKEYQSAMQTWQGLDVPDEIDKVLIKYQNDLVVFKARKSRFVNWLTGVDELCKEVQGLIVKNNQLGVTQQRLDKFFKHRGDERQQEIIKLKNENKLADKIAQLKDAQTREHKAATKIQNWVIKQHYNKQYKKAKSRETGEIKVVPEWHAIELAPLLPYGGFIAPPFATNAHVPIAAVERSAQRLVRRRDRDGLRRLAYTLFSAPVKSVNLSAIQHAVAPSIYKLTRGTWETMPLPDFANSVVSGAKEWRKGYHRAYLELLKPQPLTKNGRVADKLYWGDDPEKVVEISHGGGLDYIKEFLAGKSKGYPLENGGTGIQVSPGDAIVVEFYSGRARYYFDTPAVLKAKIKAKYLLAAPNGGEAGLPPESVRYLEDVRVMEVENKRLGLGRG